jgi:hypothetical protein
MLAPIELLGPLTYYLFKRYQVGSGTKIEDDAEAVKKEAKEAKEGQEDYARKEAEEAKDNIVKVATNQSFLAVIGVGLVAGLIEGFLHGSAFSQGH